MNPRGQGVDALESLDPPGRFLARDTSSVCSDNAAPWAAIDDEDGIHLVPHLLDSYRICTECSKERERSRPSAFLSKVRSISDARKLLLGESGRVHAGGAQATMATTPFHEVLYCQVVSK